jgi:hypothetical protein
VRRWWHEHLLRLIPAPGIVRGQVSASNPPIDAEQVDAVGFTAQHPLSLLGQPKRQPREDLSVAERWGCRKRTALLGLDETHRPASEPREGSMEPGVSEERRILKPLRLDESRGSSPYPGTESKSSLRSEGG